MNRLSDEILNKYLDGELKEDELKKISNQIEFSEEDRKRYLALRTVHNGLKKIKQFEVPAEFTSLFMSNLVRKNKAKNQQKVFIFSISSVFIIIILIILGFMISSIISSGSPASSTPFLTNLVEIISLAGWEISNSFKGKNLSIIGSVLSFGFILTAYFFFDFHKQFRRFGKLN